MLNLPEHACARTRKYLIVAGSSNLQPGQLVSPRSMIGVDLDSRRAVTAGCSGRIAELRFLPGENAVEVKIACGPLTARQPMLMDPRFFRI